MWLLESRVKASIEHAEATGFTPTAEQVTQFSAMYDDGSIMSVMGSTAEIKVTGVLTKSPSIMARIFGGGNTTYQDIIDALAQAQADPRVADIRLSVDSPGGEFGGLFQALAAIQTTTKPVTAYVDSLAASAAYAIVTQADRIIALDKSTRFGSVGVVAGYQVNDSIKEIASTNAPKKRPDISTDEGVAAVREELDAMHDLFVDAIATGRGTTVANVNSNYGMGACLLAQKALDMGMIDAIGATQTITPSTTTTPAANSGIKPEIKTMDLATLQAQHPATFAAAVQQGIEQERDRVTAHVTMGKSSGAIETALNAIADGSALTLTLQSTYMAAGMNRSDVNARQQDEPPAATTAVEITATTSDADNVAAMVAKLAGVKA